MVVSVSSGRVRALEVERLRARVQQMQDGRATRVPVARPSGLRDLVQLRTGGSYRFDDLSLVLPVLAAVSQEGSWIGLVGAGDVGVEAAAEAGIDLARTVVVPDPGRSWLEVLAALIDVLPVVFFRPTAAVSERTASRVEARLRKRSGVLLVQGAWPGAQAHLWLADVRWSGLADGHGRLQERRARVACRRGTAPERYADVVWSGARLLERPAQERQTG